MPRHVTTIYLALAHYTLFTHPSLSPNPECPHIQIRKDIHQRERGRHSAAPRAASETARRGRTCIASEQPLSSLYAWLCWIDSVMAWHGNWSKQMMSGKESSAASSRTSATAHGQQLARHCICKLDRIEEWRMEERDSVSVQWHEQKKKLCGCGVL